MADYLGNAVVRLDQMFYNLDTVFYVIFSIYKVV